MAFIPTWSCECATVLQTVTSAGISTIGVGNASVNGVSVGMRVSVGAGGVEVKVGRGEGGAVGGREVAEAGTAVDEGRGAAVAGMVVDVRAKAAFVGVVPAGFISCHSQRNISSKWIATINLKRS